METETEDKTGNELVLCAPLNQLKINYMMSLSI